MKVAEARFHGNGRSHHRRCPSGNEYRLRRYPGNADAEDREWTAVESVEDAEYLSEQPNIEVRWKPLGRLKAASDDALEAVSDLGYSVKQRLVGSDGFNLDVAGNASEEDLDEALRAHVRELQEEGEL